MPGFDKLAAGSMRKTLSQKGVASIGDLRDICVDMEVELIACQMTMDLFGWQKADFFDGVSE